MKIFKSALVAAALLGGGFVASAASAAPAFDSGVAAPALTENVRVVCNEWGRCWRVRPRGYGYGYYRGPRRYGPPPRLYGPRW